MPRASKNFDKTLRGRDEATREAVASGDTGVGGTVAVAHTAGYTPTLTQARRDYDVVITNPAAATTKSADISAVDATNFTVVGTANTTFEVVPR